MFLPSTWTGQSWTTHLSELCADLLHVLQKAFSLGILIRKGLDHRHQAVNTLHVLPEETQSHPSEELLTYINKSINKPDLTSSQTGQTDGRGIISSNPLDGRDAFRSLLI